MLTYRDDQVIGESLRANGTFEESHVETVVGILGEMGHPISKDLFVDVGANIGTHTIWALRRGGFEGAIAVEPAPDNVKLLRCNIILADLGERCQVVAVAASAQRGTLELQLSPTNFGDHRVASGFGENLHGEAMRNRVLVPSLPLGEIIGARVPGMVWIDTQGFEAQVLAGAPDVLNSTVPIVIEFWPYGLERAGGYQDLRNQLISSGRCVIDIRRWSKEHQEVLDGPALDSLYSELRALERGPSVVGHTDLLIV